MRIGDVKLCNGCQKQKPATDFYKMARDGLYWLCKVCARAKASEWRAKYIETDSPERAKIRHLTQLAQPSRARHRNIVHALTKDDLLSLWENQKGLCALSGEPMTCIQGKGHVLTNASVDRIDSSGGYTRDNVQLVCLGVNIMKYSMSKEELISRCSKILLAQGQDAKT